MKFGVLALAALVASQAAAQDYPTRTVRIIVPSAPGGGYDVIGRLLAERFTPELGQAFVVENRPGGGTLIGTQAVANAAPDGYTLLIGGLANMAFNRGLHKDLRYDPVKDFAPVALVAVQPNVLVVHPSVPVHSVTELIAYAKQHPGQLNYASTGVGVAAHLSGELFKAMAGVDLVHVPYKGAQPALTDVLAGQVQVMFATSTSVLPFIKAGRLRTLAVTTARRSASLPDMPTVAEAGVPGFESITWHGVVVPVHTPSSVVERLNCAINAALAQPDLRERLQSLAPTSPAAAHRISPPTSRARFRSGARW